MSLTFEAQLADVPKQLENYAYPHLDDLRLRAMLCVGDQKRNTVGIEVREYTLQTPLKDYIVFGLSNETGELRAAYYKSLKSSRQWIRAPNVSFLVEKGAIPVADLGRIRLPEYDYETYVHNRLYYSSVYQIAIELIQDLDEGSYTRYLSRNVSNLTCGSTTTAPHQTSSSRYSTPFLQGTTPHPPLLEPKATSEANPSFLYVGLSVTGAVVLLLFLGAMFYYYEYYVSRHKAQKKVTGEQSIAYGRIPSHYVQ
jgi:hypothetical protein